MFAPGILPNGAARIGVALHSETLALIDIVADKAKGLHGLPVDGTAPQARPFALEERAMVEPHRPEQIDPENGLTPTSVTGARLLHYSGASYTGIAQIDIAGEAFGLYSSPEGIWWVRPWDMFADGRFTIAESQTAPWANLTDTPDA